MWIVILKVLRSRTAREIALTVVVLIHEHLTKDRHAASDAEHQRPPRAWDEAEGAAR